MSREKAHGREEKTKKKTKKKEKKHTKTQMRKNA